MNLSKSLAKAAIDYYNYLDKKNKGLILYSVSHIEKISITANLYLFRFKINSKLNLIDDLRLQVFDKIYPECQIDIKLYDEDNKTLILQISPNILEDFPNIDKIDVEKIKIVCDLKYLIENVYKWFTAFDLCKPKKPKILKKSDGIRIFNNCSEEQINAIKTALSEPLTYIWGAPGTGKTQYVLTNAVLNYTTRNKRTIILAPTNNALEQIMSSLIKVTDEIGISRNKIIRLGTPTKKFFDKYPEVCDNNKLFKILKLISKKIDVLENILQYKKDKADYEKYSALILKDLNNISAIESQNTTINEDILDLRKRITQLKQQEKSISLDYDNILIRKKQYIDTMNSVSFKIKNWFNSKEKNIYQEELEKISKEENNAVKKLSKIHNDIKELKQELKTLENKIQTISLDSLNNHLRNLSLNKITHTNSVKEVIDIVNTKLNLLYEKINSKSQIYEEYENDSVEEIKSKLKNLTEERSESIQKSKQARIDNSLILGMTLDNFISTQIPSNDKNYEVLDLSADHIFLDEAGYSSLAKSMSIFSTSQPITLLGDHFQLPPVNEMDEDILRENPNLSVWSLSSLYSLDFLNNGIEYIVEAYKEKIPPDFESLNKQNLTLTYRFGQNLLNILSSEVYNIEMKSAPNKEDLEIFYIDASRTSISSKKRENLEEVNCIYNYILSHLDEDIAILAPYKNQISSLKKKCWPYCKDNIMTIHGSQGQEWDTVILSVCDTYDKYFTDSCRNDVDGKLILNTAISRVKKKLIIVCDYHYWTNEPNQLICKLLKIAKPY